MSTDEEKLQEAFIKLAEKHPITVGGTKPSSALLKQFRIEYITSCIQEGMDITAAIAEGRRFFVSPEESGKLFDDSLQEMVNAVEFVGGTLNARLHFGVFNTGSFNASIQKSEYGYLVFVNFGLTQCVYQAAKVMHFGLNFSRYDEWGRKVPGSDHGAAGWSSSRIVHALSDICTAYWQECDPTRAPRYPYPAGFRLYSLQHWTTAAENYVVAHEIGHLLAGHLEDCDTIQWSTPDGDLEVVKMSHQNEFQADLYGLRLLLAKSDWSTPNGLWDAQFRIAGPALFFCVAGMLERVGKIVFGHEDVSMSTHPPTRDRINCIRSHLKNRYGYDRLFEQFDYCDRFFTVMTDVVIDHLLEKRTGVPSGKYDVSPIVSPEGRNFGVQYIQMRYA